MGTPDNDFDFKLNIVRQKFGSKDCQICCVAMLTGLSVEKLIDRYGTDKTLSGQNYWSVKRADTALVDQNWGGLMLNWSDPERFSKLDNWEIDLWSYPAMVGVKSTSLRYRNGNRANHAVVYCPNRRLILDPQCAQPQLFSKYEFISWQPLVKYLPGNEGESL